MITPPSKRRKRRESAKINLTSYMDAIFIFIFFLLMSSNFIKVFEINSPIPVISNEETTTVKDQLALTVKIGANAIDISSGTPATHLKKIGKVGTGYDLKTLQAVLVQLKEQHPTENTVTLLPEVDLAYEELVKIMDAVRMKEEVDRTKLKKSMLFDNIIFGNIGS